MSETYDLSVPEFGKASEINLVEWKVAPGDSVEEGMELVEVETMKSTFSVEAPVDGKVIQILVDQGGKVEAGDKLAVIKSS
ncbi:biotin/lipoyl-binding protein [Candidatus Bipolaricaulota bacterium]|nr:biotin/lipoyl-binding protein [Candidatus Bipolaricaulota bacterium]MBS3814039.1 biotin/lipoyl-binding protein [Candidatus Bipolaricaulota bacterium]MBS3825093.1 biotin/lipoyl-binding protein [Candidatus Bipolaricaulota bacterium]